MKYCRAGRADSYGLNCCQSMELDKLCVSFVVQGRNETVNELEILAYTFLYVSYENEMASVNRKVKKS